MSPRHNLSFYAYKTSWLAPESLVSMCPSPHLWVLHSKQRLLEQNYKSLWVPDLTCRFVRAKQRDETQALWVPALICVFCMQNSDFWSRITSLYGSQTSPVVLCMYNIVLSIRITSFYGSSPSSVDFDCKTASLGTELYVCMCPRPHLSFCACKTAWLALVSMGPSPHLWFLHAKQRVLDQNYNSLRIPDLTFRFVHAKHRDFHQNDKSIWVPALICGFSLQNSEFWTGIKSIWVTDVTCASNQSDLHQNDKFIMVPALIPCKTATFRPDLQVCMGPRPHLWVWAHITACLAQE